MHNSRAVNVVKYVSCSQRWVDAARCTGHKSHCARSKGRIARLPLVVWNCDVNGSSATQIIGKKRRRQNLPNKAVLLFETVGFWGRNTGSLEGGANKMPLSRPSLATICSGATPSSSFLLLCLVSSVLLGRDLLWAELLIFCMYAGYSPPLPPPFHPRNSSPFALSKWNRTLSTC